VSDYLSLEALIDIVGEAPALRLVAARGGSRIYVPGRLSEDHWLVALIGAEAAGRLVDHVATGHGGGSVELPRGPAGRFGEYRRRLMAAAAGDASAAEIARELRIHGRTVRRARRKLRKAGDARQGRLL
jgi:hypothetical protein